MKNNYLNNERGLIKMIIVIVIAIAILSWYGVDIKEFLTSPQVQKNFGYIWNLITNFWTNYMANSAHKLWEIWLQYIWAPFMQALERAQK